MTKSNPTAVYTKGTLYQISCTDLKTYPNQPRKYFDEAALQDLADSIKEKGVLQPILFRVDDEGALFLVAGERRLQAAIKCGLKLIPAILIEDNPDEVALVENILREDLTAIEHAEAVIRLMDIYNYNQEQVAVYLRKAKSTVSEILSLARLPDAIRDECRNDPKTSRKTLIKIAKIRKPENLLKAYEKYKTKITSPSKRGAPKGEKRKSFTERFSDRCENLVTFISEEDFETWDVNKRSDLISRIEELKRTADSLIMKIEAAPMKEPEPPKVPKTKKVVKEKVVINKKPAGKPSTQKGASKDKKTAGKKGGGKTSSSAKPKT